MEILLNLSFCNNLPAEESLELSFDDKEEIKKRAGFKNICDVQFVNIGPGIARHETITSLEKIQDTTINLVDVSGMIPLNSNLSAKPHNYYIQAYRINNEDIYVIGITSSGEVSIIKHFGFNPYGDVVDGISTQALRSKPFKP